MMIPKLLPQTRVCLLQAQMTAMETGCEAGVELLEKFRSKEPIKSNSLDSISLSLQEAYFYYLNYESQKGLDLFDSEIEPFLERFEPETALPIAENRMRFLEAVFSANMAEDFYQKSDQLKLAGIQLWSDKAEASIARAKRDNKHFDTMKICWQQLLHGYEMGNWSCTANANRDFARESLELGYFAAAVHHAMLACDDTLVPDVTKGLLNCADVEVIRDAIALLLSRSCLLRHSKYTAMALKEVWNIVPDLLIEDVFSWFMSKVSVIPDTPTGPAKSLVEPVWDAVAAFSPRFTPDQANQLVKSVLGHPWVFSNPSFFRRALIQALCSLVRQLETPQLEDILDSVLLLATEKRSGHDFEDVINTLCGIYERVGDSAKAKIHSSLYPPNTPVNSTLQRVAQALGKPLPKGKGLDTTCSQVASDLRLQVQHLGAGESQAQIGSNWIMSGATGADGSKDVVQIGGAMDGVVAMIANQSALSEDCYSELVQSILDMLKCSENAIANRIYLAQALRWLQQDLSEEIAQRAITILEPLALGEIEESSIGMSHADATNPLNRFRMGTGDPNNLQGVCLMALANLENFFPDAAVDTNTHIFLAATVHKNSTVRSCAYAAIRDGASPTSDRLLSAILGIADHKPRVAETAISVFHEKKFAYLAKELWPMLRQSFERVRNSKHIRVRCEVAAAIRRIVNSEMEKDIKALFAHMLEDLKNDVAYTVRTACFE